MYKHPTLDRNNISSRETLNVLIEGNRRFVNNVKRQHNMLNVRDEIKDKQHPFASILGCSDSRTTVELVFDQNLGDIFSVRLAGNIASGEAIGSLEFSCKYLGSKIIVVMGHTHCGAIKAACDHYQDGHIGGIIKLIDPAVESEKTIQDPDRHSKNELFVDKVCFLNVQEQMDRILSRSSTIKDLLKAKEIGLIGAVYNLSTGIVEFDKESAFF